MIKNIKDRLSNMSRVVVASVIGVIVGTLSTAIVLATIPDNSGVIHGCYKSSGVSNGSLRIIDSATTSCSSNETAISWNQSGPAPSQDVYGNSYSPSYGDVGMSGFIYLTVPGFGNIVVTACDSQTGADQYFYNTTSSDIRLVEGSIIAPGDRIQIINNNLLMVNTGSPTRTAYVSAGITNDTGAQKCYAIAHATVSP